MYNVTVANRAVASESSYEKAVAAAKSSIPAIAAAISAKADAIRSNPRLYRSPKTRRNVADALLSRSLKGINAVRFPKKAGDVSLDVAGINLAIQKV